MRKTLDQLLALDDAQKAQMGVQHTPKEIRQQPDMWIQTAEIVAAQLSRFAAVLDGAANVVVTGAGTSDYVGITVQPLLRRRLAINVQAISTTDIVADPDGSLPQGPLVMVSVARSGNSPESVAAVHLADQVRPDTRHIVITCNSQGELARWAAGLGERGVSVVLPAPTNDKSLAMTSSYSSMVVACWGLAYLNDVAGYRKVVEQAAAAGTALLTGDVAKLPDIAALPFRRAVFLGNGCLKGAAIESHLKLQEMTAGQVMCQAETSLGLRHGPMAVLDKETLIVHYLSSDPYTAQYEHDILAEIRAKGLGIAVVAVGGPAEVAAVPATHQIVVPSAAGVDLPDDCKTPVQVIVGQLLGLFRSLEFGLSPDAPSRTGVINRVVQGVRIYPYSGGQR